MAATTSDIHRISVSLADPDVVIEPGGAARLMVDISNLQENSDRLQVEVQGIDIEWYNIPVSALNLGPGAHGEVQINFRVTRSSENRAGSYPFVVRVLATETGESALAQAMLEVKPFHVLQADINPRRAVSTVFSALNDFEVTVSNQGNTEQTVELSASDPEDECVYEFDLERVTLKPGHEETVPLAIRPRASALIGSSRLYGFAVQARSVDDGYLSARAQGQIERHALISPLVGVLLAIAVLGSAAFFAFRPVPPPPTRILNLNASPNPLHSGDPITVSWNAQGDDVHLTLLQSLNGSQKFFPPPSGLSGNMQITAPTVTAPTDMDIIMQATGRGGTRAEQSVKITVDPAPVPPKAVLHSFTANTNVIHIGEQVTLSWTAKNDAQLVLDPGDIKLSPMAQSYVLTPNPTTLPSDVTYQLRAFGQDPNAPPASRTITIHVVSPDTSVAKITYFSYSPKTVYIGDQVKIGWAVQRGPTITLSSNQDGTLGSGLSSEGHQFVTLTTPTTFTLTAADNLGHAVTKQFSITPVPKPAPPVAPAADTGVAAPPTAPGTTTPGTQPSPTAPPAAPPVQPGTKP